MFNYVNCFQTLWSILAIKADQVTFCKGLESASLNGRMVDKDIGTVVSGNETKPFRVIKPLHFSLSHYFSLLTYGLKSQNEQQKKATKLKVFVAFVIQKLLDFTCIMTYISI
jgi:hypothetical protein